MQDTTEIKENAWSSLYISPSFEFSIKRVACDPFGDHEPQFAHHCRK